jgi:riboflavin synthase
MFTGIIEDLGKIVGIREEGTNIHFSVSCLFLQEIKIDQSIAHDGVCLTVVAIEDNHYTVTAIQETLNKTNLSHWKVGHVVNLERAMKMDGRLDGHIVQGHVDQTATCVSVNEEGGSWTYTFQHQPSEDGMTIEKGSITVNGISLTVVNSQPSQFSVCIIPYTYQHTNIQFIQEGSVVNLEFDVFGKYVLRYTKAYQRTFTPQS